MTERYAGEWRASRSSGLFRAEMRQALGPTALLAPRWPRERGQDRCLEERGREPCAVDTGDVQARLVEHRLRDAVEIPDVAEQQR